MQEKSEPVRLWETLYSDESANDGTDSLARTYARRDDTAFSLGDDTSGPGATIQLSATDANDQSFDLDGDASGPGATIDLSNADPNEHAYDLDEKTRGHLDQTINLGATSAPDGDGAYRTSFDMDSPSDDDALQRYIIERELGRGGMGVVDAARQSPLNRLVAMKTVLSPKFQRALIQEAMVTGTLNHPNIISVHDLLFDAEGKASIAMPLVDGEPWSVRRKRKPHFELLEELDILLRVAQAVEHAHDLGILHNDLKLENVMVGDHGNVVLMDWGCAAALPSFQQKSVPLRTAESITTPFGTPWYMPPELACGDGSKMGPWTDIYLLGGMLYEILENSPPRRGTEFLEVVDMAVRGEIRPLCETTSPFLRDICLKALQPEPTDRYRTASAFIDDLRNYFSVRSAETLSHQAEESLTRQELQIHEGSGPKQSSILELQKTINTFEQAEQIWSSPIHQTGVERSRSLLANTAIQLGDLSLAEANVECLPDNSHPEIRQQLANARDEQKKRLQRERRFRIAVVVLALLFVASLIAGNVIVARQRALAETRLEDIEELSAIQLYQELSDQESELWPATPAALDGLVQWRSEAQDLVAPLPKHESRLESLSVELGEAEQFSDTARRWEYETLTKVVKGLTTLKEELLPTIESRIQSAKTLEESTINNYADLWKSACQAIRESEVYGGLEISPQLGLIPLGENQQGLWEFSHALSGDIPEKGEAGEWQITEESGVVLVLLPAGTFTMGATLDPSGPNYDPRTAEIEQPPHSVTLDAFFISKYELTQAQWLSVRSENPSSYIPGVEHGKHTVSLTHPVEHMTWVEATRTLRRLDLILPTEAQAEYANRAGTSSIYWGGDTVASMRGKLNISDRVSHENGGPASWKFEQDLDDGFIVHAPVGSFGANGFGLHDTAGNVWEWCSDRYGAYTLPTKPSTGARIVDNSNAPNLFRGGGFRASSVHARSADRYSIYAQDYSAYDVGIRAARHLRNP